MSKVGDLYYEILFKDGTDKGLKAIEDKIKKLNTKLSVGIDENKLEKSIQGALNKPYTINVKANLTGLDDLGKRMDGIASNAAEAMRKASESLRKTGVLDATAGVSGGVGKKKQKSNPFLESVKQEAATIQGWRKDVIESRKQSEKHWDNLVKESNKDPFGRGLRRVYTTNIGPDKKIMDNLNGQLAKSMKTTEDFLKTGADKKYGKINVNGVPTWKVGYEEKYRQELNKQAALRNTISQMNRLGITTTSVTDLPKKGSASYDKQLEERRSRINQSVAAYKEDSKRQAEALKRDKEAQKRQAEAQKRDNEAYKQRVAQAVAEQKAEDKADKQRRDLRVAESKAAYKEDSKQQAEAQKRDNEAYKQRVAQAVAEQKAEDKADKQRRDLRVAEARATYNEYFKRQDEAKRESIAAEKRRASLEKQQYAATKDSNSPIDGWRKAVIENRKASAKHWENLAKEASSDPFGRGLRRVYTTNVGADKKIMDNLNGQLAKSMKTTEDLLKTGADKKYGKINVNGVPTWKVGYEEKYRQELNKQAALRNTISQMNRLGITTTSVTDLPKKGSAAYDKQLEERRSRINQSVAAYKDYFKQQDEAQKRRAAEDKADKQRRDLRVAESKAAYNEYFKQQDEALKKARENAAKMEALRSQGAIAKSAAQSAMAASSAGGRNGYYAYASGMEDIRRKAVQSAWDIRNGKTPAYNAGQIAEMSQRMNGWMQQYNSMLNATKGLGGQIDMMRQTASNAPGKADEINKRIEAVKGYRLELSKAAVMYRLAMGGDATARAELAKGMYSSQWLQTIQKRASAAGDAVRNMTRGMQVTTYAQDLRQVADELANVRNNGSSVAEVLGRVFSVYAAKEFFDRLVQIGGEFEKQKLALASMFNSAMKADTLYSQIQALAVRSPFTFGELTSYTKQMSAYGIQYKDIYDTTKRLADISAGVGVPMSRVILAYGQVSTAHFLRGQELRQFTEAGIPLVDALAKRFTKLKGEMVSANDVFEMISNRSVKFEDVKAVLDEMTDKGGRFYNMQDVLSESLSGKWSNLQDSIEIMFSEIEADNKGLLKGIVETMTAIVRSWKSLMPIGAGLVAVYAALATKQQVWTLLSSKATAMNARIIADAHARTEALERETAAYNRQTAAIHANSTPWEKNALRRAGFGLALKGAESSAVMKASNGVFAGAKDRAMLMRYSQLSKNVTKANAELGKASRFTNKLGKSLGLLKANGVIAFAQMRLGAQSLGAALMGLITWTNGLMAALFISISLWTDHKQKVDEMNEHVRESIKGMKGTYKELTDFIKANPIELAIASDNATEINELYKSYKDKIENAPIDLGFVMTTADQMTSVADKLRYMRKEVENLTFVTSQFQTVTANTTKALADETDEFWFFGDSLGENLKDYNDALHNLEAEKTKMNKEDYVRGYHNAVEYLYYQLNALDAKTQKSIESRWLQMRGMMEQALSKGDTEEYLNLAQKWNLQNPNVQFDPYSGTSVAEQRGVVAKEYKTMEADIKKGLPIIEAALNQGHELIVEKNGQIVRGEKYTLKKLTDQGYQALVTMMQDYVNSGKWSKEEMDAWLTYIEQHSKAATGATWQQNTRVFRAFLNELKSKYKETFDGTEFTGKFNESQQKAINQAANNLPEQYKPYEKQFLQLVQNMTDKVKGMIADALDMSGAPGESAPSEAQEIFNKLSTKGSRTGDGWRKTYAVAAPRPDESTKEWAERLAKEYKEHSDKEYFYKNTKQRTASVIASQNAEAKKKQQINSVLWEVNPIVAKDAEESTKQSKDQKKEDAKNRKAESAAEKAERERLKKLRDRMNRLQDIKNVYKKMAEIYGETDALQRIASSALFAADGIPQSVNGEDAMNTWISTELGKVHNQAGTKTAEQRSVSESALKSKIDIDIEIDRKQFDRDVKQLERDLKKNKEQWDRYMSFRDIGVSQEQSVMLTFGDGSQPTTEADLRKQQVGEILKKNNVTPANVDKIVKMDKDQLSDYFMGNDRIVSQLTPVVEAYQEAWREIVKKNDEMYKAILENAKTYEDKINALQAKKDKNETAIRAGEDEYAKSGGKSGLSPEMVTRLRAANDQDYEKQLGDVQMDQLRNSESYLNFFNAVTTMTVEEATRIGEAIQKQLTAKLAAGTISAKDYADEIGKIQEQMSKVRNNKTLSQATWQGGLMGRVQWQKQNAQDIWNAANNAYGSAKRDYDEAALKGNKVSMDNAQVKMDKARVEMENSETDKKKAEDREKKLNDVASGIAKFSSAAESLTKFRDSVSDTISSFGGDTDKAGFQTLSTVVDSVGALASGAQDVMQKMMSGDFVGASFAAITSPLNVITAFNKLHDQKLQRQIELSERRSAEIKAASDQIQHAIEKSLGSDAAKENAIEAYKQLSDQMYAAGKSQMGDSYKEIYKALTDGGSYIRTAMDNMWQGGSTDGLKGSDFRKQEVYNGLAKEGFYNTDSVSAYGAQYFALLEQRKELESRLNAENSKKDSDKTKMADYRDQLSDLNNQIRDFKDTMLNDILGLDFKSWADNLASNLIGAFKQGQDAAEAFSNSVNDMLGTITQNAIKNSVIMPYINKLKGEIEDAYDINKPDSIDNVVDIIYKSENGLLSVVEDAQRIWTKVDQKTHGALSSLGDGSSSGSTLQGNAKGLTEETGTLLASYLNAMRADVSMNRTLFERFMKDSMPKVSLTMEAQLKELSNISKHTALIVQNTQQNVQEARMIRDMLSTVVTVGSGGKAVRIK